jgi:hypothetical protein
VERGITIKGQATCLRKALGLDNRKIRQCLGISVGHHHSITAPKKTGKENISSFLI